jgi:hypothetical protein
MNRSLAKRLRELHDLQRSMSSSPWSHNALELAIATILSVKVSTAEDSPLVWLLLIGPPGSGKTSIVQALKDSGPLVFVDQLTPESFLSGARDPKSNKLAKSLLPRLNGQCLVVKDLTTLLSGHHEKVRKVLGDLQSIYDGEFAKAIGTGFDDPILHHSSRFSIIGCVTPEAWEEHQRYLQRIGSRFLVSLVAPLTDGGRAEGFVKHRRLRHEMAANKEAFRGLALSQIAEAQAFAKSVFLSDADESFLEDCALLIAKGRTPVEWERVGKSYERQLGTPEEPFRAYGQLRTLLRCLTAVNGRPGPTDHERGIVTHVARSSLSLRRAKVVDAVAQAGNLSVEECARRLDWGETASREWLEDLKHVGILASIQAPKDGSGRPGTVYYAAPRFAHIIQCRTKEEFPRKTAEEGGVGEGSGNRQEPDPTSTSLAGAAEIRGNSFTLDGQIEWPREGDLTPALLSELEEEEFADAGR